MAIEKSLESVIEFWNKNQKLVEDLRGTASGAANDIKTLADQLEQHRKDATQLIGGLETSSFQVAKDEKVKESQRDLIGQIKAINDKISKFKDSSEITTGLYADRAQLYLQLADTFDEATFTNFVPFTPDDLKEIDSLLKQAALDTISRQKLADVLGAAVKLTELALKVAVKIAAA
jgi:hypothetical protein